MVLLQEVDRFTRRSGGVDQLGALAAQTGANGHFFAKAIERQGGEYGVGVLCRNGFELDATETEAQPAEPIKNAGPPWADFDDQEAIAQALAQWPSAGIPENPAAWLMTTAKRRAIDQFRAGERQLRAYAEVAAANVEAYEEAFIIDHVEEHTVSQVLDAGYWAGMTLYPRSKCSLDRAIDILEIHGPERLWMNSACDWGVSDPLAVPKCALQMKCRQHTAEAIERIIYQNPREFLSQSSRFAI